jgi:hypothetical protein
VEAQKEDLYLQDLERFFNEAIKGRVTISENKKGQLQDGKEPAERLKSKELWQETYDDNSKFFH